MQPWRWQQQVPACKPYGEQASSLVQPVQQQRPGSQTRQLRLMTTAHARIATCSRCCHSPGLTMQEQPRRCEWLRWRWHEREPGRGGWTLTWRLLVVLKRWMEDVTIAKRTLPLIDAYCTHDARVAK